VEAEKRAEMARAAAVDGGKPMGEE